MKRRTFVAATAAVLRARAADGWQFFTPEEISAVEALTDAIIPADQDPVEPAGGGGFINWVPPPSASGSSTRRYRDQIPKLDAACREASGKTLAAADLKTRTEFLERVDRGEIPGRVFFEIVIDHTMQGFYGSPKHGANANAASWKMLGIEKQMGHRHEA